MASFETLLEMHRNAAERYVHYRCASPQDAEDILQDVYFTAHRHFHFGNLIKSTIISIFIS